MKTIKSLLTVLLVAVPLFGFAQEWDDIYADPTQKEPKRVQTKTEDSQKKKVVIVQGDAAKMEVTANSRDVDEYNRRGSHNEIEPDTAYEQEQDNYEEYAYTDRIVRFHDPESSIKITGADEVIVYINDDLYENYNNRGWNTNVYFGMGWGAGYYPWYDSWYDPWYYGYGGWYGWGSPWYYSRWSSPWYYGWHSPWRSPWYYGGWYDPWYYGGYWGGGGYYRGFHDGYYSSLPYNRTGRSTGIYRRSAATSRGASSMAAVSGRTSRSSSRSAAVSGRSSTAVSGRNSATASSRSTRSAVSGRSNSAVSGRSGTTSPRTRIVDSSGRVYDSRNGRTIDRSSSSSRTSSINRATQSTRSTNTYNSGRSTTRSYERNATTPSRSGNTYQRNATTPSRSYRSTTPSRSSNNYSTPSRSSSSSRSSSTYSAPSRSSSSSGSFGGGGSSGRSSGGSSGRSGRR